MRGYRPQPVLDLDLTLLADSFGRSAAPFSHDVAEHPLLEEDAIAGLADALPPERVERDDEVRNGWRIVLRNVELDPEYARLVGAALDELVPYVGHREGGMRKREAFVVLSGPGSATASHVDPEHNLVLQVRGTREVNVGSFLDPDVGHRQLERSYGAGRRELDRVPAAVRTFLLEPGAGVYIPPHAPHWVKTRDEPSVALSITFKTRANENIEQLYAINALLRRLRLSPRPPAGRLSDRAKILLWRSLKAVAGRG